MGLTYEDFSLWIEADPSGGGACVRGRCRGGEGRAPFRIPDESEALASHLKMVASGDGPKDLVLQRTLTRMVRRLGETLFGALFVGEVGRLFERSRGALTDPQRGLRIRIHLDPDLKSEISDLPWELLACPDTRDQFGLHRLLPVVRFFEVPRAAEQLPFEPPLRVLLAAAGPPDAVLLNLGQEIRVVHSALRETGASVRVLEHASLEAVRETLRREPFHVFHFMGHGDFNAETGVGSLFFELPEGGGERVSGEILASHLHDCRLHAAVLNACQSGRNGTGDSGREAFGGVAAALVQGGFPAVVAMREPIWDDAAITFSRTFYRELGAGEPIEAAVSEARLAIYRSDPGSLTWAIPALYQRTLRGGGQEPAVEAAVLKEPDDSIHFGETSQIEADSLDLVNQWGSDTSTSRVGRIRNDGRIKVSGHMIIANRKSGHPPEN